MTAACRSGRFDSTLRPKSIHFPLFHYLPMNANRHLPFWFPLLIVLAALQVQADDSQPRALIGKEGLEDWEPLEFGGSGEVLVKDGVLSIDEGVELSGVKFSKPESLPTSNYEIEFEARRTYGFDFFCALTFPVGDLHTCAY